MTASHILKKLAENGESVIKTLRASSNSPYDKKVLRTFNFTEACTMIGRSTTQVRKMIAEKNVPAPNTLNSKRLVYTLKEINECRDYFNTRPHKPEGASPFIIAVANFKGGVTKSTTAAHVGQSFAQKGYRVLVVDCDTQGSETQVFGFIPKIDVESKDTLLPFLLGQTNDFNSLIRTTYWDGLDLIPANISLNECEFKLILYFAEQAAKGKNFEFYNLLNEGLRQVYDKYDVIILDCPPSMGMLGINAAYAANGLLVPCPTNMLDFTSTNEYFYMLCELLERLPEKEYQFIRVLISKFEPNSVSSEAVKNSIQKAWGDFVMENRIHYSEAIKKASAIMKTLYEIEKYDGNKQTFTKALSLTNNVCDELEILMTRKWEAMS